MAPGLLVSKSPSSEDFIQTTQPSSFKPSLYILDELHPAAVAYAQELFDVVLPTDPAIQSWKDKAEFVVIKTSTLAASDIQSAGRLKAIGKQGVGIDRIDAEACKQCGIQIFNTPGANSIAVAELVLALAMSVAREIPAIQVRQSNGETVQKQTCSGLTLSNRTLGLIGMGNIATKVAMLFRGAFDASIIAYDPFTPEDAWSDLPHIRAKTADEVFRSSDVLSIHVPLTERTRDMITYKELSTMKRNAILINAARGGIVNEKDLCAALEDGLIWGAGIDCHEQEPPTQERYGKMWRHPRVVSTPHIGAATDDAQMSSAKMAIDKIYDFAYGSLK